jgi:hypothetical protein
MKDAEEGRRVATLDLEEGRKMLGRTRWSPQDSFCRAERG